MGTVFSINLSNANYSILHEFGGRPNDGTNPEGGLVISGGILYGTTQGGGTNGNGTVFSLNVGNTNYIILHSFHEGNTNDGAGPVAGLTLSGGTLYGTTAYGGTNNHGIVFAINTTGAFTNLYSFKDGADGAYPETALLLSGNTLFGTTLGDPGSASNPNYGTIFSITTGGGDFTVLETYTTNGFAVLHTFSGLDGAHPSSQLALSGSAFYNILPTVYGTTASGGANGYGTVFKVTTDGTGFADLYDFKGTNDGKYPNTGLLISAGTLYGATTNSIFKINTDGSGFTCLTNVSGASQLLLSPSGAILYGSISNGGASGNGSIFGVNTDGSGFTNLYSFTGGGGGQYPNPGLELYSLENPILNSGSTVCALYGTTYSGGANNLGMVFSVNTDGSGFSDLHDFTGASDGGNPAGGLVLNDNNLYGNSDGNYDAYIGYDTAYLYGITSSGGTYSGGTIFEIAVTNGSPSTIYNFSTNNQPKGKLGYAGGTVFGTDSGGGAYTNGMVFRINSDGSGFTDLYDFNGGGGGGTPLAGLTLPVVDNPYSIWSLDTTFNVSAESLSNIIYSIAADNDYVLFVNGTLASCTNYGGPAVWSPYSSLAPYLHPGTNDVKVIIAGDADDDYFAMTIKTFLTNALFGTAYAGGFNSDGTIFEITPRGYETNLYLFSGPPDGQYPIGDMVFSGSSLYGVTQYGGTNDDGEIFKINTNGSGYANLYSFGNEANDGINPYAGLILSGNELYGTTEGGGANHDGTIFRINTDGSGYTNLYSFGAAGNTDGANPEAPLLLAGTNLYGTTVSGGANGYGAIFSICTNGSGYAELYSFNGPPGDGSGPQGRLTVSSNTLYGTTYNGGVNDVIGGGGTVFSFTVGRTNDQILHYFANTPDGVNPSGGLTLSGNRLYGSTERGGNSDLGTIFSVGVDGSGYNILASFDSSSDTAYGQIPRSDLLILGTLLYGTTYQGGAYGNGIVFNMNTNGTGFNDIYDFVNPPDGNSPAGGLCAP